MESGAQVQKLGLRNVDNSSATKGQGGSTGVDVRGRVDIEWERMEFFFLWLLSAFLVRYEARSSAESEKGQKCWRFEKKCET